MPYDSNNIDSWNHTLEGTLCAFGVMADGSAGSGSTIQLSRDGK